MTHARDNFLAWLRAAHAAEEQAIIMLTAQARRIESYPDLKERIDSHLSETVGHAAALKDLLDRFSGSGGVLVLRDMAAKIAGRAQGVGGMLTSDEVIKGMTATYAFEHQEIAQYRVLIAAADELEEFEAKTVFERILGEEIAMAEWLETHIETITRVFLMRDERNLLAKR